MYVLPMALDSNVGLLLDDALFALMRFTKPGYSKPSCIFADHAISPCI